MADRAPPRAGRLGHGDAHVHGDRDQQRRADRHRLDHLHRGGLHPRPRSRRRAAAGSTPRARSCTRDSPCQRRDRRATCGLVRGLARPDRRDRQARHGEPRSSHLHGHRHPGRPDRQHPDRVRGGGARRRRGSRPPSAGRRVHGRAIGADALQLRRRSGRARDRGRAPTPRGATDGTGALDTSTEGPHTYTVTATSQDGQVGTAHISYTVVRDSPRRSSITAPVDNAAYLWTALPAADFTCIPGAGSTVPVVQGDGRRPADLRSPGAPQRVRRPHGDRHRHRCRRAERDRRPPPTPSPTRRSRRRRCRSRLRPRARATGWARPWRPAIRARPPPPGPR